MVKRLAALAVFVSSLIAAPAALATVHTYYIVLSGTQEFPANASPATGSGVVTLDDVTNLLSWNFSYSGLVATESAAHFHGPAARGVNAGVAIGLSAGSPKVGSTTITPIQTAQIVAGNWYANVHSTTFPGGEIRGQLDNLGPYDTTPNAFTFTDAMDATPAMMLTSNTIAVSGTNGPAAISVTGGEYSIGCTLNFTATNGTIAPGANVCVRHMTSASQGGMVDTVLTIGGVSDTFTSTVGMFKKLKASLSPLQEVPPTASTGSGTAMLTFEPATNHLMFEITFSGLTGEATMAHFHGFAFPGTNAGIKVDIGAISGLASPMMGMVMLTAGEASELLAGGWYINIHTAANGGGEIRGQVVAAPAVHSDASGDSRSDVIWRNAATTQVYQWQMNGTTVDMQGFLLSVPANWSAVGLGDFNGDSMSDVLWRDTSGLNYLWMLNGTTVAAQGYLPSVPAPWMVVATGDFENGGKGSVLWRNPSNGQNYVWNLDGTMVTSQGFVPTVPGTDWEVVGAGDFDGNGRTDIFWRNKVTGQNYIWPMNSIVVSSPYFMATVVTDWEVAGTPDANGDGRADVVWRNQTTGQNYIWLMNGMALVGQGFLPGVSDLSWKVVGFGDYNGDGKGDVLWRHSGSGLNYLWIMDGLTVASQGYTPSVGDQNWVPIRR